MYMTAMVTDVTQTWHFDQVVRDRQDAAYVLKCKPKFEKGNGMIHVTLYGLRGKEGTQPRKWGLTEVKADWDSPHLPRYSQLKLRAFICFYEILWHVSNCT